MFERRSRLLYTPPRYCGALPFETRPRLAPRCVGRIDWLGLHWVPRVNHGCAPRRPKRQEMLGTGLPPRDQIGKGLPGVQHAVEGFEQVGLGSHTVQ